MKELREILAAFESVCERGEAAVLASVVHVSGSTYRRAGARLLVTSDDTMIGLISGGCLEGDLLEHAKAVLADGAPALVHYDASEEDDLVWGLGLGCAGTVDVLLERVDAERRGPLRWLASWSDKRRRGAIATGLAPELAARAGWTVEDGPLRGELWNDAVGEDLQRALADGRGGIFERPAGRWAIELFRPPPRLVLFGAGPDAAPLTRFARELGWDAAVLDHRAAYARADRFAGAAVSLVPVEAAVDAAGIEPDTYCVVMTHHYLHDRRLLGDLIGTDAPYVAVLGPRQRTEDLLADLAADGIALSADDRDRLFAPAGLDLGADAPEQIALSIVAEIQAFAAGRSGGWLRDRKGPIHDPEEV